MNDLLDLLQRVRILELRLVRDRHSDTGVYRDIKQKQQSSFHINYPVRLSA